MFGCISLIQLGGFFSYMFTWFCLACIAIFIEADFESFIPSLILTLITGGLAFLFTFLGIRGFIRNIRKRVAKARENNKNIANNVPNTQNAEQIKVKDEVKKEMPENNTHIDDIDDIDGLADLSTADEKEMQKILCSLNDDELSSLHKYIDSRMLRIEQKNRNRDKIILGCIFGFVHLVCMIISFGFICSFYGWCEEVLVLVIGSLALIVGSGTSVLGTICITIGAYRNKELKKNDADIQKKQ